MNLSQIKQKQKQILLKEIENLKNAYQERCRKFLSKVTKDDLKGAAKDYLKDVWWQDYEPQDRELQLALIKFEQKYE